LPYQIIKTGVLDFSLGEEVRETGHLFELLKELGKKLEEKFEIFE